MSSWQASVERTVTGLGYDLVDVERSARGLLRVFIDRVPGRLYPEALGAGEFVTVDDCECVTRQLLLVLEVDNIAYERLEVSSPGIDRLLSKEADFERFAGEAVDITLKELFQGRKHWRGVLGRGEAGWTLELESVGKPASKPAGKRPGDLADVGAQMNFTFDEVREARLVPVIDFKGRRAPRGAEPGAADSATG